eukprot:jgi/Chlat1/5857/Chrsp4S06367
MVRTKRVGKYELGRTLGEGTFAKVKYARDTESGRGVAIKVVDKDRILRNKMRDQLKKEIAVMRSLRPHPCIVQLLEVLASRSKIYLVLELVTGGELFDKVVAAGCLPEAEARKYFQQLIDGIEHCHTHGICHRDIKPENLLLDSQGHLKISDFGLSALPTANAEMLKTTCGTPNYVAPEVLADRGYDGKPADIWACGVVLYVLLAGYLPFDEPQLSTLFKKIKSADFTYPSTHLITLLSLSSGTLCTTCGIPVGFCFWLAEWLANMLGAPIRTGWIGKEARSLITSLLEPNPYKRLTLSQLKKTPFFQKHYLPSAPSTAPSDYQDPSQADLDALFNSIVDEVTTDQSASVSGDGKSRFITIDHPARLNAFELLTLSSGLDLSAMFNRRPDMVARQTRFVSRKPPHEIMAQIVAVGSAFGFTTHTRSFKVKLEGNVGNCNQPMSLVFQLMEMAPNLYLVEARKMKGDTIDYHKMYQRMRKDLEGLMMPKTLHQTAAAPAGFAPLTPTTLPARAVSATAATLSASLQPASLPVTPAQKFPPPTPPAKRKDAEGVKAKLSALLSPAR